MKQIQLTTIEYYETIAADIKKEFYYSKSLGEWYYGDRGSENIEEWSGPFKTRFDALSDAVEPYVEDSE